MAKATTERAGNVAAFPSSQLRAIPAFEFTVPDGWELEEAVTSIAAVHPAEPVDGFWVNVLVNHDRVPAALNLEEAVIATMKQLLHHDPQAKVATERIADLDGRRTYLRIVQTAAPDDGKRVTQIHALFFAPLDEPARTADLFQIIGTVPDEAADDFGPSIIEIVKSFRFD